MIDFDLSYSYQWSIFTMIDVSQMEFNANGTHKYIEYYTPIYTTYCEYYTPIYTTVLLITKNNGIMLTIKRVFNLLHYMKDF